MVIRRRHLLTAALVTALAAVPVTYAFNMPKSADAPMVVPSPPATCQLSPHAPHFYANNNVDGSKAGGSSTYKRSAQSLGHSAVPYNFEQDQPRLMLFAVQAQYLFRLCGDAINGPDPQLLKLGYASLDVAHLARAATHWEMNPNAPLVPSQYADYLATYLGALQWDKSEIQTLPARELWVVEVTGQLIEGTMMHRLHAVKRMMPEGPYLKLAVRQPDGSLYASFLWLDGGFAPTYVLDAEVPAALMS